MPDKIVLIGPPSTQTTAVGKRIADSLGLTVHSTDDYSDEQWVEFGYDGSADIRAWAQGGAYASYRLLSPMRVHAIESLLAGIERGVLVLPADFVVQDDPALRTRLAALFAGLPHVVALLPTPDPDENAMLLDADLAGFPDWSEVNAYWVRQPSNERLATQIVYTRDKTEVQTRDEILRLTAGDDRGDIILIGPKLTGKTTLGRLLADALGVRQVSLDMVGRSYLPETDFDQATAVKRFNEEGLFGWLRYQRPYEAHIVERTLQDERDCVIDFGGGHSVYEDEALFARVQRALAPYRHVLLILPSPDKDESIRILNQRSDADTASERTLHRLLVTDPSYNDFATQTIYTKGKSVDEIADEAVALLRE